MTATQQGLVLGLAILGGAPVATALGWKLGLWLRARFVARHRRWCSDVVCTSHWHREY